MAVDNHILDAPAQPLEALDGQIRDGDLFLCSGKDPFSRLIGWATKSPWTHVAVAVRWPELGRIMVFECVQRLGVRAVPLQSFISQSSSGVHPYPGKIVLARHRGFASPEPAAMQRLADAAVDRLGDHFSPFEIVKIAVRIVVGKFNRHMPKSLGPENEYICSEYIARCFKAVGIQIQWDGLGFIAPADFANDPQVEALARVQTQ